jgi:pyruvate kinase
MAVQTKVDLLLNRRTKVIATVGPASSNELMLDRLIRAGVSVFRLNMSHGDHDSHRAAFEAIASVSARLKMPVGVLADLCGPKIRTGRFAQGEMLLEEGARVTVSTTASIGGEGIIVSQYQALVNDVSPGDAILLADGVFELIVLEKAENEVICEVVHGGMLGDNKGINLPGVNVSAPSMTEKDYADAQFSIDLGVDFIALSFVRTAADVQELRRVLSMSDSNCEIIAKIEKPEALDNADAILAVSDAIMIARGDLGVELPPEQVPSAQQQLIELAQQAGKPVIVATQMLESMIKHSRPTRAEVTDVARAVESRADAVMLSAETAAGDFPVESVEMMDRIARQTEAQLWKSGEYGLASKQAQPPIPLWTVIAETTARMSRDLMARGVMVVTRSGRSAEIVSTARPAAPIVAITRSERVYRKLCLRWGVIPLLDDSVGTQNPNDLARGLARELGLAESGQYVLLVRGFHGDLDKNLPSVTVIEV